MRHIHIHYGSPCIFQNGGWPWTKQPLKEPRVSGSQSIVAAVAQSLQVDLVNSSTKALKSDPLLI